MSKAQDWQKIQDFQNENKGLFVVVADPRSDSISMSFGGLNAFVRFPMDSMEKGVIFNALRKSKFEEAIEPFMAGLIEGSGVDEKTLEGSNLLKVIGGGVKSFGDEREKLKAKQTQKDVKTKRNRK